MKIRTASLTNRGGRSTNDDTVRIFEGDDSTWVYVGDGLGAYAGGQQASQAAGQALSDGLRADTARRIADIRASEEGREGLQSFLGKRSPGWLV